MAAATRACGIVWDHCRAIQLTDGLREKLELYQNHGRIPWEHSESPAATVPLLLLSESLVTGDGFDFAYVKFRTVDRSS